MRAEPEKGGARGLDAQRKPEALVRLGAAVRARREALGLSQEALAERTEHHRNFIGGLERGEQNVSFLGLLRVAEGLGCSPEALVREALSDGDV